MSKPSKLIELFDEYIANMYDTMQNSPNEYDREITRGDIARLQAIREEMTLSPNDKIAFTNYVRKLLEEEK